MAYSEWLVYLHVSSSDLLVIHFLNIFLPSLAYSCSHTLGGSHNLGCDSTCRHFFSQTECTVQCVVLSCAHWKAFPLKCPSLVFHYSCLNVPPSGHPPTPTVNCHTVAHVSGSFFHVLCLVPSPSFHHCPLPPPVWALSVRSMFHSCLWFCFVRYFILFIRFHL